MREQQIEEVGVREPQIRDRPRGEVNDSIPGEKLRPGAYKMQLRPEEQAALPLVGCAAQLCPLLDKMPVAAPNDLPFTSYLSLQSCRRRYLNRYVHSLECRITHVMLSIPQAYLMFAVTDFGAPNTICGGSPGSFSKGEPLQPTPHRWLPVRRPP